MQLSYSYGNFNDLKVTDTNARNWQFHAFLESYPGNCVVCIDPGTTSNALVISDIDRKAPVLVVEAKRVKAFETTPEMFTNRFVKYLERIFNSVTVKVLVIENQYRKFKHSDRVLTSFTDACVGVGNKYNAKVIKLMPPQWMPVFLEHYSDRKNIKLNKVSKTHLVRRALEIFPRLSMFGRSDVADAFGITFTFFKVYNIDENKGEFEVKKAGRIDYKHNIVTKYGRLDKKGGIEEMQDSLGKIINSLKSENRNVVKAEFHEGKNLEDNIRSCTTHSNAIFTTVIQPSITNMADLYKNREDIGKLREDSQIYIIFTRAGYEKKLDY